VHVGISARVGVDAGERALV